MNHKMIKVGDYVKKGNTIARITELFEPRERYFLTRSLSLSDAKLVYLARVEYVTPSPKTGRYMKGTWDLALCEKVREEEIKKIR